MPLPATIVPARPRVHHKRRGAAAAAAGPAPVTVASVTRADATHALWVFSAPVVGNPQDLSGLRVGGNAPGGLEEVTPGGALLVSYDEGVGAGDAWTVIPAGFVGTFAGGGTLQAGAGVVG